jgi:cell division protein FtsZ
MKISPKIKIVGVGGAGGNALSRIARFKVPGVELVAINTDLQDLKKTAADTVLRIGRTITQGLGTGMNPEIGRKSAEEQREEIKGVLKGSDMIFIAAGLGGGTGTGAAPVVAEAARDLDILTVAVATRPFSFEGATRKAVAQAGVKNLQSKVDCLFLVSNDKLVSLAEKNMPLTKAFSLADEILHQAVISVIDLVLRPSLVAIGFADIRTSLKNSGQGYFGQGLARGQNRAQEAVLAALNSPLLENTAARAPRLLFNVSARNLKLAEVDLVASFLAKNVLPDCRMIFGAREDEKLKPEEMKLTLLATGL